MTTRKSKYRLSPLPWCAGGVTGLLCLLLGGAQASTTNFKGNLVGNPLCVVNDNQPITVEFGDILTKDVQKIIAIQYERDVPYTLECDDASDSDTIVLSINGNPFWYSPTAAIVTSKAELGLVFYVNGEFAYLNTDYPFSYNNEPTITVRPWGSPSLRDNESGDFSAVASLTMGYQ